MVNLIAVGLGLLASMATASPLKKEPTAEYLLSLTKSSRPDGIDPEFDCAWRKSAYAYAPMIQPWITNDETKMNDIFLALELGSLCNQTFMFPLAAMPKQHEIRDQYQPKFEQRLKSASSSVTFFVDPINGKDNQPFAPDSGSITKPFKTIDSAVAATRAVRSSIPGMVAAVMLRGGVHYMAETLSLGPEDSSLTIAAYNNEQVVVSGGVHIDNIVWKPSESNPKIMVADLSNQDLPHGVPALQYGDEYARVRAVQARYPNANPEVDLFPKGYITANTNWSLPEFNGQVCDPRKHCGKSVTLTKPAPVDEWHGMYQDWTTGVGGACDAYFPDRSPWCSSDFYPERQIELHTRHPSGVDGGSHLPNMPYSAPGGAMVHAWRPGHWYTWMFEVDSMSDVTNVNNWTSYNNSNNVFGLVTTPGQSNDDVTFLGTFGTEQECFAACQKNSNCKDYTWHHPDFPQQPYRSQCYFANHGMWNPHSQTGITSARGPHIEGGLFKFGAGGNQGGEGNEKAGEWFVTNVQEELDSPGEFFFDPVSKQLYLMPNATEPPSDVVVPTLANLIEVIGSQQQPVTDISITGITFTANRPTFMEPRTNPSGGDWALERMGAVYLQGTEMAEVHNNTFVRLDSNAVFLSGYNRNASITVNNFRWLGQNAIASWGTPVDNDGTNGDFPRYTLVQGNFIHEIGHIQKQSSFYFQAETAQAIIKNNICFNIPRAAINFNDGFGGGAEMAQNLLFNSCRESSDHGAFNSWDRLPYFTTVRNGTASTIPAMNNVHRNFIVANYAADGGCLDNDDGSSYYDIHHNFCVFGGHKSDFDGNMKFSRYNIHAYPSVYGDKCLGILAQNLPPKGYAEQYTNNICILKDNNDPYLVVQGLNGAKCLTDDNSKQLFIDGLTVGNNTIYSPGASAVVKCAGKSVNISEFQSMGYDKGTTMSSTMPSPSTIIGWADKLLAQEK